MRSEKPKRKRKGKYERSPPSKRIRAKKGCDKIAERKGRAPGATKGRARRGPSRVWSNGQVGRGGEVWAWLEWRKRHTARAGLRRGAGGGGVVGRACGGGLRAGRASGVGWGPWGGVGWGGGLAPGHGSRGTGARMLRGASGARRGKRLGNRYARACAGASRSRQ